MNIIVTGASQGIGKEVVKLLAQKQNFAYYRHCSKYNSAKRTCTIGYISKYYTVFIFNRNGIGTSSGFI